MESLTQPNKLETKQLGFQEYLEELKKILETKNDFELAKFVSKHQDNRYINLNEEENNLLTQLEEAIADILNKHSVDENESLAKRLIEKLQNKN